MPTSASTKAITARRERYYPLRLWQEASEGFPMIDVYRWWMPKLDSMEGNFDVLTLWHTLGIPGVDMLSSWHTDSLHAQAVDLLSDWGAAEHKFEMFDMLVFLDSETLRVQAFDAIRDWDLRQDHSEGGWRIRVNMPRRWRTQADHAKYGMIEEWNAGRDLSREVGKWQWTNELSRRAQPLAAKVLQDSQNSFISGKTARKSVSRRRSCSAKNI